MPSFGVLCSIREDIVGNAEALQRGASSFRSTPVNPLIHRLTTPTTCSKLQRPISTRFFLQIWHASFSLDKYRLKYAFELGGFFCELSLILHALPMPAPYNPTMRKEKRGC